MFFVAMTLPFISYLALSRTKERMVHTHEEPREQMQGTVFGTEWKTGTSHATICSLVL
jgi:hypothetical protein